MGKKTLVLGASPNASRYSYAAVKRLSESGHDTIALGLRSGKIGEIEIVTGRPEINDLHTVSLYIGPDRQPALYQYLLSLNPRRIIFNPGTENAELARLAREKDIETVYGCTLVMLALGTY